MPVSRSSTRRATAVVLCLCALAWAPELQAESAKVKFVKFVGKWCLAQIPAWFAGKAIDEVVERATGTETDPGKGKAAVPAADKAAGESFRQQLEKEIPRLVAEISTATGPQRAALQENLEVHRDQLAVLSRLLAGQGADIAAIRADQERLLGRIESLDSRLEALEVRVDRIDARVDELDTRLRQVEEALITECLDLRYAPALGLDGYRVKETPGGWSTDRFDSDELSLDLRLLLNSCSADLTLRGLVIQLAMVTRDLDGDLTLYANWKGVGTGGYTLGGPRLLARQEIPLARPGYRLDGQVVEIFFPYDEIPGLGAADRLALALVLTHDGTVLYTLPDRVLSCVYGQRVQCRWGR